MYCGNCGNKLDDGVVFCPYCGASTQDDTGSGFQEGNMQDAAYGNIQQYGGQNYGNGRQYGEQNYGNSRQYSDQNYGNGQQYGGQNFGNKQKPIYKQWWFWILIALLVVVAAESVVLILKSTDESNGEAQGNTQEITAEDTEDGIDVISPEQETEEQLTPDVNQEENFGGNSDANEANRQEESSSVSQSGTIVVPSSGQSAATAADASEYIFPESNSRYLTETEVRNKSKEELRLARNELFARHGRMFEDDGLAAYFESKSWYKGTVPAGAFNTNVFNVYEKYNLELIQKIEDEKK